MLAQIRDMVCIVDGTSVAMIVLRVGGHDELSCEMRHDLENEGIALETEFITKLELRMFIKSWIGRHTKEYGLRFENAATTFAIIV
jgi:hypothetical protein